MEHCNFLFSPLCGSQFIFQINRKLSFSLLFYINTWPTDKKGNMTRIWGREMWSHYTLHYVSVVVLQTSYYELVDHMGSRSQNGSHYIRIFYTAVPRNRGMQWTPSATGLWMYSHTDALFSKGGGGGELGFFSTLTFSCDCFSHLFLQQMHGLSVRKNWSDGPCLPASTIFVIYTFAFRQAAGQQEPPQEWEEKAGKQVFSHVGRQLMN